MINSIDILQQYIAVSKELATNKILPFNTNATKFMSRFLSEALQEELFSYSNLGTNKLKAHKMYMASFANALMVFATPSLELVITSAGITRAENQNAKTAYHGQIKSLVTGYENSAFDMLESLVLFLNANSSDFSNWNANSPLFAVTNQLVFRTADEFNRVLTLFRPSITFIQLLDTIEYVQEMSIEPAIGTNNLTQVVSISLVDTALKQKIKRNVQRAVAYFTFAEELKKSNISFGPNGLRILTYDYNVSRSVESQIPIANMQYSVTQAIMKANEALELAKKQMIQAGGFDAFTDSITKSQPWF